MFDAQTAVLIRSAPALTGVDPTTLPQELTGIYAELAGFRLRAAALADDAGYAARLQRIERIATVYESLVDEGADGEARRAAAFVAGTAYQLLGRVMPVPGDRADFLSAAAIHPGVAAPLLFLISEQSPDAREAVRGLSGSRLEDVHRGALLESIQDLAQERFEPILERAERLARLRPSADAPFVEQATQGLYGLCWTGLVHMVARLLNREPQATQYQIFETPQLAFDRVAALATQTLDLPGDGGRLVSSYSGPRHLARLLRHVADGLEGAGIVRVDPPLGAQPVPWQRWLLHRAQTKPTLWPNHRSALATGFLDAGTSAVLVLPTGAGKTTLSELKIAATLSAGRKVIFLVPTLALVDQLRDDLAESFPSSLANYEVSADGDLTALIAGPELKAVEVMTPERLLAVLSFGEADMDEIGLIVFDECHLLSPDGGGARSVDAMLCLLHALKRTSACDFLLLSAMLRNGDEVAAWLGDISGRPCVSFSDAWKPSRQARGVVAYREADIQAANLVVRAKNRAKRGDERFLGGPPTAEPFALFGLHHAWARNVPDDIRLVRLSTEAVELGYGTRDASPNANVVGITLARKAASAGLKTIMFVQQANHAPSAARRLHGQLRAPEALTESENSYWQDIVAELGGAAHSMVDPTASAQPHNGDMISLERRLAESLFRRQGGVDVIVATPTLAQGMNLPAQVAILAGTMRHDEGGRQPLKHHEILNAAGRAGRAGHLANGTVLLIPEPVVSFAADEGPSDAAYRMLEAVLPQNDQCVLVDDPLTRLLDAVQGGQLDGTEVRYFLSRLRAGASEDQAIDQALTMMNQSFAAFQMRRANAMHDFDAKIAELRAALEGEAADAQGSVMKVAAFSGLAVEPLAALVARVEADIDHLPTTVVDWVEWLVDFFIADRASYALLFGSDVETVKAVTRGRKTGGDSTDVELDRLKQGLRAWLEGRPFNSIETALGVAPASIRACGRARDLVLRIANRRLYMIANAAAVLVRETLAARDRISANPAVLEVLAVAIRKGLDSPEKAAFAYRSPSLRSRVLLHQRYDADVGLRDPIMGQDFLGVMRTVEAHLAFGRALRE